MHRLTLKQRLRSGHVKRWQIVRVAREQTIAEHMYRVNLITNEICLKLGLDGIEGELASQWALVHDLSEVMMGDVATPTKKAIKERTHDESIMMDIELSFDDEIKYMHEHIKSNYPIVLKIVKIADLIEAVDFLEVEGMGKHALAVKNLLTSTMQNEIGDASLKYPGLNWGVVNQIVEEI